MSIPQVKTQQQSQSPSQFSHLLSGVQTLLSAASALEEQQQQQQQQQASDMWSMASSPWADHYESCRQNLYSEAVQVHLASPLRLNSEAAVYNREEWPTLEARLAQPLCSLREVVPLRRGVVAETRFPEGELILEYKVSENGCQVPITLRPLCLLLLFLLLFFSPPPHPLLLRAMLYYGRSFLEDQLDHCGSTGTGCITHC